MKILHLIQKPQLRGAEVFASQLASHTNRMGNEAIIVCVFNGAATLPFEGKLILLNGQPRKRLWDIKAWKRLAGIIKEESPDIIQANAGDTLKYAVISKLLFRWKQPIFFRNASTISLYIKSTLARKWNGFLFRYADRIISVSQTSALDFARLFPEYKHKIITIPIGIETESGPVNIVSLEGRRDSGYPGAALIHVGGFTFEKNHLGLLNIFEQILKKIPGAVLYLLGDGPRRKEIEEAVAARDLKSKVVFLGFRPNPMDYIRGVNMLLLPSIIEGLPGVILEAFYCKIAVVAYNAGGINEILVANKTGHIVPVGDETGFANEVIAGLEDTAANRQMILNAQELVLSQYTNADITGKFLNAYSNFLDGTQTVSARP